jgi:tetratricopeptide (TPR) repeat protein
MLGLVTLARNEVYRSKVALWGDVVAKTPHNEYGHYNLAHALEDQGRFTDAVKHYRLAVKFGPEVAVAHNNLANLLVDAAPQEALEHYYTALSIDPEYADAHNNLARLLVTQGEIAEAVAHCRIAAELRPKSAQTQLNLANLLAESQPDEAIRHYERALALEQGFAEAHFHLGNTLVFSGRISEGINHLRETVRLKPNWPEARENLAILLEMEALNLPP